MEQLNLPEDADDESSGFGTIVRISPDGIVINLNQKIEFTVSHDLVPEEDEPKVGDKVLVSDLDNVSFYFRVHPPINDFEKILRHLRVGDRRQCVVTRRIKGGWLVDIGVNAFLPESAVDPQKCEDLNSLLNQNIEVVISKVDEVRRYICVALK